MDQLSHFFNLPAADQRRVLQAGMLVIAFRLGLWMVPYRHLQRIVDKVSRRRCEPVDQRMAEAVRNVVSFSRFVPSASCLTQALATQVLLKREGFDPKLQIGVTRDGGGAFRAHAWVEYRGQIVVGEFGPDLAYMPMAAVKPTVATGTAAGRI